MLGFFSRNNVFEQRRQQQEVWRCMRRIADSCVPNMPSPNGELRSQDRFNRCVPAALVPWVGSRPVLDELIYGVTKDVSDDGIAFLATCELAASSVVCMFHVESPVFLFGELRRCVPFGGGFWQSAVSLRHVIPASELPELVPLAEQLEVTTE